MSGFLDNYGVSDARREGRLKKIILTSLGLLIVGFLAYYFIHDWGEKRQVSRFIDLLKEQKYEDAYKLWGCDAQHPCRDYNFQRFMEDWGPKSPHANLSGVRVRRTRSCDSGVIQILQFGPGDEVPIMVSRADKTLGFSPFSYCVDASGRNTKLLDIFFR
jgi:hypothetical protein